MGEHVKLEASAAEEQNLLYEQSDLRIEVVELTRLAAIKADEREQKARDFMRAEMRYHRAVEDLKTKQLQIQDLQKQYQEKQIKYGTCSLLSLFYSCCPNLPVCCSLLFHLC